MVKLFLSSKRCLACQSKHAAFSQICNISAALKQDLDFLPEAFTVARNPRTHEQYQLNNQYDSLQIKNIMSGPNLNFRQRVFPGKLVRIAHYICTSFEHQISSSKFFTGKINHFHTPF